MPQGFVKPPVPTKQGPDPVFDVVLSDGTKARGRIENNKLLIWQGSGTGPPTPARDGIYKTGDGKSIIIIGGKIARGGASGLGGTVGPDKPPDKPKSLEGVVPSTGSPTR